MIKFDEYPVDGNFTFLVFGSDTSLDIKFNIPKKFKPLQIILNVKNYIKQISLKDPNLLKKVKDIILDNTIETEEIESTIFIKIVSRYFNRNKLLSRKVFFNPNFYEFDYFNSNNLASINSDNYRVWNILRYFKNLEIDKTSIQNLFIETCYNKLIYLCKRILIKEDSFLSYPDVFNRNFYDILLYLEVWDKINEFIKFEKVLFIN